MCKQYNSRGANLIIGSASLEQFNNGLDSRECAIVLVPVPQALLVPALVLVIV